MKTKSPAAVSSIRTTARVVALAVLAFAAACGGSDVPTAPETGDPVATTVDLSLASLAFTAAGQDEALSAVVRDQRGDVLPDATVTWSSSDTDVATVDADGLVTATGLGTATVTATSGAASGTVVVVVQDAIVAPSFSSVVNEIFVRRGCTASNCHGGGSGGLTLETTPSANYAALVRVPSNDVPSLHLVEPGNAADSYLVRKLEGNQSSGARMPIGGAPLSATDLQNIKNWINAGAPNN